MDYTNEFYTEYSFFIQLFTLIIVTINIILIVLKDREKKSYLTLTPSIESHEFTSFTIKVNAYNKSKRAIMVLTCHLLTKKNEDITANYFISSTQVDNSGRSISKEQIDNITIRIPYKSHIDFYFKDIKLTSPNSFIAYIECEQEGVFKRIESHSEFERILRYVL